MPALKGPAVHPSETLVESFLDRHCPLGWSSTGDFLRQASIVACNSHSLIDLWGNAPDSISSMELMYDLMHVYVHFLIFFDLLPFD